MYSISIFYKYRISANRVNISCHHLPFLLFCHYDKVDKPRCNSLEVVFPMKKQPLFIVICQHPEAFGL